MPADAPILEVSVVKKAMLWIVGAIVLFGALLVPTPTLDAEVTCTCTDFGAMDCVIRDKDGYMTGWLLYPNHPNC